MHLFSRLLLVAAFGCYMLLLGGCPSPEVNYTPTNTSGGAMGNADYEGDKTGQITESFEYGDGGQVQETLGSGSDSAFDDQQSDAYKRINGRCSPGMKPVYFQFDRAVIEQSQLPNIENNAAYLLQNPNARVLVEGNTDDRGTNEYNLALGERRAQVAKKYLIRLGVSEGRIRTVSYGEERPLFLGQNEDDYALNRRDDFVLE